MKEITVTLLDEAIEFTGTLSEKQLFKLFYNIELIKSGIVSIDILKKLNTDIWEIRTVSLGAGIRVFAFWSKLEKSKLICTHGIIKKTSKVSAKEIEKAIGIMNNYYKKKQP
ncbi:MAG: type II toxin-antitoxin system RelE/ParE family toxin [Bacteroidota bacterium]|nr:type II toxin-antitoxin system RelE/ParE family toxin [Bacteroidota bacterium]